MQRPLTVLLVEDDRAYARLVTELLSGSPVGQITHVTTATRLSEAVARLDANGIDVVLLDLGLPDSRGLDGVVELRRVAPHTPLIVLTGRDDTLAPKALRAGAQDYLVKGSYDADVLVRSIRYAVERQMLLERLESRRIQHRREHDRRLLDALAGSGGPVGREMLGREAIEVEHPDLFDDLLALYRDIVIAGIDDVTDLREGDPVERLVERLVAFDADAADVIRMHESLLGGDTVVAEPLVSSADEAAARAVLIEVLARLLNAYRADRWTAPSPPAHEHERQMGRPPS